MFGFSWPHITHAATSPTLVGSAYYSVLGATTVTNAGGTVTNGEVGVSAGSAITGFPPGVAAGSNALHLHSNDASAIAAQADNLTAFGALNAGANADANCLNPLTGLAGTAPDATDLTGLFLAPGLYCSAGSFLLTNGAGDDLTLTGAGPWVFKMVSALTTSPGSSVVVPVPGVDECNVWWRVGSSAIIDTTTAFVGNVLALTDIDMLTGATLVGRLMAQTAAVDLDTNTITGCAVPLVPASLTLNKIVSGGSAHESEWTLTATGPTSISGPGAAGAVDVVGDVTAGTYTLSESVGVSNYDASAWSCVGASLVGNSVTLDWGDPATCTITNTYHEPASGGSRRATSLATLRVIKNVINNNGGTATSSDFTMFVKENGGNVLGSPQAGTTTPGTLYRLSAGTYVVSENTDARYTQRFSGDCNISGSVTLSSGDNKTCTVTNDDVSVSLIPGLPNTGIGSDNNTLWWYVGIGVLGALLTLVYLFRKKQIV